jgi:uncharacterized protein YgfB (UPF0149 family)
MISYTALAEMLARTGALGEAAEYHGTLCGLCCGMPDAGPAAWLERALAAADAEPNVPEECRAALEAVARDLHAALTGGELEFAPVLPDDDHALAERAVALARWCEGFLYGLAVADAAAMRALKGDAQEALADFARIARTAVEANASETDEVAYAELVEFVRVGVQLVYEELQRQRGLQR